MVIEAAVSEHKHARPGLHRINFSRYFSSRNINQSASSPLLNTTPPLPRSYGGDRQCAPAAPTPRGPARSGVASQAAERREADHCRLSGVSHPPLTLPHTVTPSPSSLSIPSHPSTHPLSTVLSSLISLYYRYPRTFSPGLALLATLHHLTCTLHRAASPASLVITTPSPQERREEATSILALHPARVDSRRVW